eukprot:TRINITY_DN73014_c0_g1_i1.p1 TRINITY_DN73014_c0_g1~~TRINITY_DN73014_c0_g1_i1.p1  ORF type:complete len:402 (+),score=86.88 TRINITY_DN73014_c0_g1_i1:54-1208(+)
MAGTGQPIALGTQGLTCGQQGFGCMSFGLTMPSGVDLYGKKTVTQEEVTAIVKRAVELGCNHLDTAQIYQSALGLMLPSLFFGASFLQNAEALLKAAISEVGRDKVVIATKVAGLKPGFGNKDFIKRTCYESCERMGIDCIDLYYMHRIDQQVPIEVSMEAMKELIAEGKIKYVGLSEASAKTIRRAHKVTPITCVQMEWSLWARDLEDSDILPTLRELGIGLVAYSPLGRGMLTATVKKEELTGMDFRKMGKVGYIAKENNMSTVDALKAIADAKGITCGQLALAWLHKHGSEALAGNGLVPIPGTSKMEHMESNLKAVAIAKTLTADDMQAIEKAVPKSEFSDPMSRYGEDQKVWAIDNNISMEEWEEKGPARAGECSCDVM